MAQDVSEHLIAQLSRFINAKLGLYFPENRWNDLKRSMAGAARELAKEYRIADDTASCIQWLLSAPSLAKKDIDILAKHLTIGETYFFRDKNLFSALERDILPKLIGSRQRENKSIRIWSAGCCTGEEPYSLAILIDRLIPDWKDWNITLLATDINLGFLRKAEEGIYTNWSFRNTPEYIKKKYFSPIDEKKFEISETLKKMVTFSQLNLVGKGYPSWANNIHSMDIIFCRNVLMYFEPDVRTRIIGRLYKTCAENAWIVFSPSESPCIRHSSLSSVQFPGVTLYKKDEINNQWFRICIPDETEQTTRQSDNQTIIQPDKQITEQTTHNSQLATDSLYHKAASLANTGRLDDAEKYCRQALETEKLHPGLHYLLATICQEQGHLSESAKSLRHALYLDPNFVLAHFALGNLTLQEGKHKEAEKHLRNARSLLISMGPDETLPYSEGMTSGRVLEIVETMIKI